MNRCFLLLLFGAGLAFAQAPQPKDIDLSAPDGTKLRATMFAAVKPGPGVLLLHMCNTVRKSWEPVAKQLSQSGIHALTVDNRGFGESGGPRFDGATPETLKQIQDQWPADFDAAYQYLLSQPGVDKNRIAVGGGSCGFDNAVKVAERHPEVKALVLLAGNTDPDGMNFIFKRTDIPIFTAAAADDQYNASFPQLMEWFRQLSGNPHSKTVNFADGRHGTEIFGPHPELVSQITAFLIDVLVTSPAGADVPQPRESGVREFWALANHPGDAEKAAHMYHDARTKDPKVFLFPEAPINLLAYARLQSGDKQDAVELFKLNTEAFSASANAQDSLSDGYLAIDSKDLALAAEEKCLQLLPEDPSNAEFKALLKQQAEKKVAELKAQKK